MTTLKQMTLAIYGAPKLVNTKYCFKIISNIHRQTSLGGGYKDTGTNPQKAPGPGYEAHMDS